MICQYCHHNEAENSFVFQFSGTEQEIHLCNECVDRFQQYIGMNPMFAAWNRPQNETKSSKEKDVVPTDAGEEIRRRRQMNALSNKLKDAIEAERYEEAIVLRDKIKEMEKEAHTFDL